MSGKTIQVYLSKKELHDLSTLKELLGISSDSSLFQRLLGEALTNYSSIPVSSSDNSDPRILDVNDLYLDTIHNVPYQARVFPDMAVSYADVRRLYNGS